METALTDAAPRHLAFDLVASQPWAIVPEMLETIAAVARREHDPVEAVEARLGRPLMNARAVSLRDGVALVPVTGPIFRYANLFSQVSGATSIDQLARDFSAAVDDAAVKAVVLVIDSPGGQANGIAELASMIREAAAKKPVLAYVDGAAQSAAYWLASAAGEVVASRTAVLGSIGAVVALDAKKREGVVEIVSSQSPRKRPDVATDAGRAQIQELIDSLAQVFVEDVARHRGVHMDTVLARFGQGGSFLAAEALRRGMLDRVSTLEEVIAGLSGKQFSSAGGPLLSAQPSTERNDMDITLETVRVEHPEIAEALRQEGFQAGLTDGAKAERERILGIQALAMPGHEALVAELVADGQTSAQEAAVRLLRAEKAANQQRSEVLRAAAPQPVAHADRDDGASAAGGARPYQTPAGYAVDEQSLSVHQRATAWMKDHPGTDYLAAVKAVAAN